MAHRRFGGCMDGVCGGGLHHHWNGLLLPCTQTPAMAPDERKANVLGSEWRRASKGLFLYPARLCAVFRLQSAPPVRPQGSGLCQEPNGFSLASGWLGSAKHRAWDPEGKSKVRTERSEKRACLQEQGKERSCMAADTLASTWP